jgi:hypothetical protein
MGYTLGENEVDESRMSEIDIEYQDWKKLMPAAFQNRYKMTKDEWYRKHQSLLPKQESADNPFGRIMELAGVADGKFDKQDDQYCEDQDAEVLAQKELAIDVTNPMPGVHEGFNTDEEFDLHAIAKNEDFDKLYDALNGLHGSEVGNKLTDIYNEIATENGLHPDDDFEKIEELLMDELVELYSQGDLDEAEYQGRDVPLGKPMRGDVKKFKVYVKDPSTGNVKKVNFGHGGTSARRAGQKTMKIKKSNPARRRSFRARHNCDNPGPRTKARYWSCRAW